MRFATQEKHNHQPPQKEDSNGTKPHIRSKRLHKVLQKLLDEEEAGGRGDGIEVVNDDNKNSNDFDTASLLSWKSTLSSSSTSTTSTSTSTCSLLTSSTSSSSSPSPSKKPSSSTVRCNNNEVQQSSDKQITGNSSSAGCSTIVSPPTSPIKKKTRIRRSSVSRQTMMNDLVEEYVIIDEQYEDMSEHTVCTQEASYTGW